MIIPNLAHDTVMRSVKKVIGHTDDKVTKRRMNQTSELYDLDYEVFQVDYEWYVKDSRKCIHNFYGESVTIKR